MFVANGLHEVGSAGLHSIGPRLWLYTSLDDAEKVSTPHYFVAAGQLSRVRLRVGDVVMVVERRSGCTTTHSVIQVDRETGDATVSATVQR